jgi:hypothetical protein
MIDMKKFNKTLKFEIWEVVPYIYEDDFGNNVLLLINADETDEEKFIANCSAYMDCHLNNDEVLIKNYSENTNILDWLIKNDIVFHPTKFMDNGYAIFPICKIKLDNFIEVKEIM